MVSTELGTESLTWPPSPRVDPNLVLYLTHLVPSFLSLTVPYSHELCICPQNKTTSLQPLGLCICSSSSSTDSHHSGLNSSSLFRDAFHQSPSLYFILMFIFTVNPLCENILIYMLSLSLSSPVRC